MVGTRTTMFRLLLLIFGALSIIYLVIRVRAIDDLQRAWPVLITLLIAFGGVLPESTREKWLSRLGVQLFVVVVLASLTVTVLAAGFSNSARRFVDPVSFDSVRPGQPVTLTVSDLPPAERLTITVRIADHDRNAISSGYCENSVRLTARTTDGTPVTVTSAGNHLHRITIGSLSKGRDLPISLSYTSSPPRSDCIEDITVDTAVLE